VIIIGTFSIQAFWEITLSLGKCFSAFYRIVVPLSSEPSSKGKVHPRTGHKVPEGEQGYSPTLYLTSALDEDRRSIPSLGRLIPGSETRYPFYRRLCRNRKSTTCAICWLKSVLHFIGGCVETERVQPALSVG
jgi:hypothetical protein